MAKNAKRADTEDLGGIFNPAACFFIENAALAEKLGEVFEALPRRMAELTWEDRDTLLVLIPFRPTEPPDDKENEETGRLLNAFVKKLARLPERAADALAVYCEQAGGFMAVAITPGRKPAFPRRGDDLEEWMLNKIEASGIDRIVRAYIDDMAAGAADSNVTAVLRFEDERMDRVTYWNVSDDWRKPASELCVETGDEPQPIQGPVLN